MVLATTVICALAMAHACIALPDPAPKPAPEPAPQRGCVCPAVYRPVCGSDGRTYSNGCEANCNGRSVGRRK